VDLNYFPVFADTYLWDVWSLYLVVYMQFFHMRDEGTKNWHNYLVIQVTKDTYISLKAKLDIQSIVGSGAVIQNGKPYITFSYGGTINLSETFGSGETLGDKLQSGDIVTVILTDKPQNQLFVFNDNNLTLNFNLEEVTVYNFTYTKEMEQIYEFFSNYAKIKDNDNQVGIKDKNKRLKLRG
jgi:hypothetical protein